MTDLLTRVAPHVVVLGRQGSGKGEQCSRLARRLGLDHISSGDLLRTAAREGTALGRVSEAYLVRGEPVPDDLVAGVVAERLAMAAAQGRGVVIDGYPRSVAQAERLVELIEPAAIDVALHLDVPRSIAVERIQNRRVCATCGTSGRASECPGCGALTTRRADDWPAAIGRRMSDYAREIGPLLAWFDARDILETVDGRGEPDAVGARILELVERHTASHAG